MLILTELQKPEPGLGEILIHVYAAGVTPTELLWYPTTHTKSGTARVRAVPGHEFSGVITAVSKDVQDFETGDEVYGMNDWFVDGATAEFCITLPQNIARKPTTLSHEAAASVPIGALTSWQGLIDRAKLEPGDRVLDHGGAGAVGLYVVQLAHILGPRVITTVSAQERELLRHFAEALVPSEMKDVQYKRLRTATAVVAGLIISALALSVVTLVWPRSHWIATVSDFTAPYHLAGTALANSVVFVAAYFAAASLAWGMADATMTQPRELDCFSFRTPVYGELLFRQATWHATVTSFSLCY